MTRPTALEFLLLSRDYKTLTAVSGGLKPLGAALNFVPALDSARNYLERRKIDGVFVDLEVPGALELIYTIRQGSSNRDAVIFACVRSAQEASEMLGAGANAIVHKPLTAETVASHVTAAKDAMARERRRYFRHAVSLPVSLTVAGTEHRAVITNLSEGGMAVRAVKPLEHSSLVDFTFELSPGPTISGRGQVTWVTGEGMLGVAFHYLRGQGTDDFQSWLTERQRVTPVPFPADD
jgi:CheY-like chemotaxis protein